MHKAISTYLSLYNAIRMSKDELAEVIVCIAL
jgi:hypothetical protein